MVAMVSHRTNSAMIKQLLNKNGKAMASYMAETSTFYSYLDESALEAFAKAAVKDGTVAFAVFYDTNKVPITRSSKEPADKSGLDIYEKEIRSRDGKLQGYLMIGYSLSELSAGSNRFLKILALCIVLALGGMVLGNRLLVRRVILKPLARAIYVSDSLAAGDLSVSVNPEEADDDEIGLLLGTMDEMVGTLREIIRNVNVSSRELDQSANVISRSVQDQAIIAQQQSSSVTEITTTMEELSASSSEIADHSSSVVSIAQLTVEDTKKGAMSFDSFVMKMTEIQEENQQSITEIVELGHKSKEISKVMEIINHIADQTKLIAFNAALEASSAGESGKRFGVVAAEIRRLADSVMESTGEIEHKIFEIQEAIQRLVVSSEKGTKAIQEGMVFSMETGELLSDVVTGAESTSSAARQISLSTQQQKTASEQVLLAIREIATGAQKSAESISQMTESGKALTALSEELRRPMEQFILGPGGQGGQGPA